MAADGLRELVRKRARRVTLAAFLDALSPRDRMQAVQGLGARALAALWELAATDDPGPIELSLLVPGPVPAGHTVEWVGVNSLLLFRRFAKRFVRTSDPQLLVGHNTGAAQWLVGPGYFTVTVRPDCPSELLFDYTRVPPAAPPGWPALRSNEQGLARMVFGGMYDHLRAVGSHAAVGAAFTYGRGPRGQHFALARGSLLPTGV
ncbi:MAG: hypothetical protein HY901_29930 [Deltaproteobacteria bacterium]|nr:hypothetical protein [Deltaproteobacteria bacterium]